MFGLFCSSFLDTEKYVRHPEEELTRSYAEQLVGACVVCWQEMVRNSEISTITSFWRLCIEIHLRTLLNGVQH